jgi:hypothetical protein
MNGSCVFRIHSLMISVPLVLFLADELEFLNSLYLIPKYEVNFLE